MPELEALIDAILQGQIGFPIEQADKTYLFQTRNQILGLIKPALPVLEEIKAAAWEEGLQAGDIDGYFAYGDRDKGPQNPYKEA